MPGCPPVKKAEFGPALRCMPHVLDMQLRDAHARAASAEQRVDFEDFSEQTRPGAACFPGEVGIVLLGAYVCRRSGAVAMGGGNGDSGPVGIGAVKALAMSSRIGDDLVCPVVVGLINAYAIRATIEKYFTGNIAEFTQNQKEIDAMKRKLAERLRRALTPMPRTRHRKHRKDHRPQDRPGSPARYIMAGDLQDKHILDTSAWNALLDDPRQDALLEILRTKVVIPTTLAISEIAATPGSERRHALLISVL